MSSWQTPHAVDPAYGEGAGAGGGVTASWPESVAPASSSHTGNIVCAALELRMHRIDRESAAGPMAHRAAFAECAGVRQEVRCSRKVHMAPRARRCDRLNRIDKSLRIGYSMQTGQG